MHLCTYIVAILCTNRYTCPFLGNQRFLPSILQPDVIFHKTVSQGVINNHNVILDHFFHLFVKSACQSISNPQSQRGVPTNPAIQPFLSTPPKVNRQTKKAPSSNLPSIQNQHLSRRNGSRRASRRARSARIHLSRRNHRFALSSPSLPSSSLL